MKLQASKLQGANASAQLPALVRRSREPDPVLEAAILEEAPDARILAAAASKHDCTIPRIMRVLEMPPWPRVFPDREWAPI